MSRPVFSVILPTYRRPEDLRRALNAWEGQGREAGAFEVIVVDDGSGPETARVLAEHRPRRFELICLRQENSGPAAARNRGMASARGEFLLFSGDDIEPGPDLLKEHLLAHSRAADRRTAILGHTGWPKDLPLSATMVHIDGPGAEQFSYYWMEDGKEYDFRHFYTSNISLRREMTAREPDGFSTAFPAAAFEDVEYGYRLSRHGMRILYARKASAFHHHPYDAESFFARQIRCGEMAAILWRMRPELGFWLSIPTVGGVWTAAASNRSDRAAVLGETAEHLDAWERRALSVAGLFDRVSPPPRAMDEYLHTLFRYAYLRGLLFGIGKMARRSAAWLYITMIPPAAGDFAEGLALQGLFPPEEDIRQISLLGRRMGARAAG